MITKDQAIALGESKFWEPLSYKERAEFQLSNDKLCMPFEVFHEAVEKAIGRPVWTHEFIDPGHLLNELNGTAKKRSFQEIVEMIPEDKRIIVVTS